MPLFSLDIFSYFYYEIQGSFPDSTLMEFVTSMHRLGIISKDCYNLMTKLGELSFVDYETFLFFLLREEIDDPNKYRKFKALLKDHELGSINTLYYKMDFIG